MPPTKDQALQFALMVQAGMPPIDAIIYFFPDMDPGDLKNTLKGWQSHDFVQRATHALQGKLWQEMTLEERINYAVDKHYAEMAYYLYSRNYALLQGTDKQKADTCRTALEAKLAGTAGKQSPLYDWWDDVRKGKVKLGGSTPAANLN